MVSAALFLYMVHKNYSTIDINYWTIAVLIPIVIMGYWLKTQVTTPEAASILYCFIYFDSTFLASATLFSMMHALGFRIRGWMRVLAYGASCAHIALVCFGVHNDLYYRSKEVVPTALGTVTKMASGPLKIFHYAFIAGLALWFLGILLLCFIRRGTYSRRSLTLFGVVIGTAVTCYLVEALIDADFSTLPFLYVIGDIVLAANYDYVHTHDIAFVLSGQQKKYGERGYIAIGMERQFQSCNDKALELLPFLQNQHVNGTITGGSADGVMVLGLLDTCEQDGFASTHYQIGDLTYACEVRPYSLRTDGDPQGYLLSIKDATEEVRNYRIVTEYNKSLNAEIKEKTKNIQEIQQKIVLGMADMIENRDNNTGGHVKRTSDIIRILVDEIIKQGNIPLSDEMVHDIVRAAPTHDLGKITIDSSILNKPGRFTDEEYEIMKTHAAKSGELVLILLDGVEEERFVKVAFNVARFHHERWDGRGYPEGLVGTMIPLEARIMAVADVYDALVSKRVYKEAMSFEKARAIMVEGMGTQFDPSMRAVFLGCCDRLEEYYRHHA